MQLNHVQHDENFVSFESTPGAYETNSFDLQDTETLSPAYTHDLGLQTVGLNRGPGLPHVTRSTTPFHCEFESCDRSFAKAYEMR
jgi:hypothetical protein